MSGFAFHPEALRDLDGIWEFIAADSPDAADRFIKELLARCAGLCVLPHQGYRRPALTSRPLRFTVVREYVLVYAPEKDPLWIVAVLHGRRNPRVLAAILRHREEMA